MKLDHGGVLCLRSARVRAAEPPCALERDYYGCYCIKFIVKNGSHITEDKVMEDFGNYGEVVEVRGPGLFSGLCSNHVYVRFIDRQKAEEAEQRIMGRTELCQVQERLWKGHDTRGPFYTTGKSSLPVAEILTD